MKKLIIIILMSFMLTGCSLIPRITYDTPNTQPQSTEKSKAKYVCKGKLELNNDGSIKSCSKGFYSYEESYGKKERRMTIVERIKSFINAIFGWGIWGLIIICILFPSAFTLIGTIIGRAIEGAFGIGVQTLKSVAKAVQKTRKEGKDLNISLATELDEKQKQYVQQLKDKENIK